MQQTTLQKAISGTLFSISAVETNQLNLDVKYNDGYLQALKDQLLFLQSLLPSERKDIEEAYSKGVVSTGKIPTPSEYFTTTFTDKTDKDGL